MAISKLECIFGRTMSPGGPLTQTNNDALFPDSPIWGLLPEAKSGRYEVQMIVFNVSVIEKDT